MWITDWVTLQKLIRRPLKACISPLRPKKLSLSAFRILIGITHFLVHVIEHNMYMIQGDPKSKVKTSNGFSSISMHPRLKFVKTNLALRNGGIYLEIVRKQMKNDQIWLYQWWWVKYAHFKRSLLQKKSHLAIEHVLFQTSLHKIQY